MPTMTSKERWIRLASGGLWFGAAVSQPVTVVCGE